MNLLFTICGRAGSKGLANKNLKKMNGVLLVYYTLAAISLYSERHEGDRVFVAVNTNSDRLADSIKKQTMVRNISYVDRKEELAGDRVAKVDVIKDTYFHMCNEENYDAVVDLDITSPMRTVSDIENAIEVFLSRDDYDFVTSVVPARRNPYFNMVEKKDAFYRKVCFSEYTARQEAPAVYELNASIYVYRPVFLEGKMKNTILDNRGGVSVMKDYLVLDIDSEEDFRMMELLHSYYCRTDEHILEIYERAGGEKF